MNNIPIYKLSYNLPYVKLQYIHLLKVNIIKVLVHGLTFRIVIGS